MRLCLCMEHDQDIFILKLFLGSLCFSDNAAVNIFSLKDCLL